MFYSLSVSSFPLLDSVLFMKLSSENREHALIDVAECETSIKDTSQCYLENIILSTKVHFVITMNKCPTKIIIKRKWSLASPECSAALLFRVGCPHQQHWHHLGAWQKCRTWAPFQTYRIRICSVNKIRQGLHMRSTAV